MTVRQASRCRVVCEVAYAIMWLLIARVDGSSLSLRRSPASCRIHSKKPPPEAVHAALRVRRSRSARAGLRSAARISERVASAYAPRREARSAGSSHAAATVSSATIVASARCQTRRSASSSLASANRWWALIRSSAAPSW